MHEGVQTTLERPKSIQDCAPDLPELTRDAHAHKSFATNSLRQQPSSAPRPRDRFGGAQRLKKCKPRSQRQIGRGRFGLLLQRTILDEADVPGAADFVCRGNRPRGIQVAALGRDHFAELFQACA